MQEAEADKLLTECREFLIDRMRISVARMMAHVEEALFEKAAVDGSTHTAEVSPYIDAVREIRMKKREIQVRFENRFVVLFDRGLSELKSGNAGVGRAGRWDVKEPEPGGAGAMAIAIAMETARAECRASLSVLDRHVSALLGRPALDDFTNPMQPGTVLDAFLDSCNDIHAGADIRHLLVEMFQRYTVADLHNVYLDLNALFEIYSVSARGPGQEVKQVLPVRDEDGHAGHGSILLGGWIAGIIQNSIGDAEIPDFIRDFLLRHWRLVLEKQFRKHGEKTKEWSRSMQVVEDLIACTRATVDEDQKRQQIWMLPGLIYRLKNGMKAVTMPLKEQMDFLSRLKSHHAGILESSAMGGRDTR